MGCQGAPLRARQWPSVLKRRARSDAPCLASFSCFNVHQGCSGTRFSVVARPSRLRVRTAARRSKRTGAGTPRELAGGTPALTSKRELLTNVVDDVAEPIYSAIQLEL